MFSKKRALKKIKKMYKKYFSEAQKKVDECDFVVDFYVIYSKKDDVVYFEPFASVSAEVAKMLALDMVERSKIVFDLKQLALFKVFSLNYSNMAIIHDSPEFACFLED